MMTRRPVDDSDSRGKVVYLLDGTLTGSEVLDAGRGRTTLKTARENKEKQPRLLRIFFNLFLHFTILAFG